MAVAAVRVYVLLLELFRNKKYVRSVERVSAQCCCIPYTVIKIFDRNCNDHESKSVQSHPRSEIIVPIKSLLVVSYLTSIVSDVVSRTVFEIFDAKIP